MSSICGETKRERYLLLDGLRGVAAVGVLLFHIGWQLGLEGLVFPHGYLAVDFFFILSGFIISDAYDRRLREGKLSLSGFLLARVTRLYPMVVFGTIVGVVVATVLPASGAKSYFLVCIQGVTNALLFPLVPSSAGGQVSFGFPLNSPMWSLFWEMVANFAYAAVAKRAPQRLWLAVVASFLILLILYARYHNGLSRGATEWGGGFVRVGFSFSVGVLLWLMRERLPRIRLPASMFVFTLVLLLALPVPQHINMLVDVTAIVIFFPILVALASRAAVPMGWVALCEWSGAISYPLYALHYPFMQPIKRLGHQLSPSSAEAFGLLIGTAAVICMLAFLVLTYFDEPLRARLRVFTAHGFMVRGETAP